MKPAILIAAFSLATILSPLPARSQSPNDIPVLQGLAPVAALATPGTNYAGQAALGANLTVTGGIQTGDLRQPTLLPFAEQQQQALRDAYITDANLAQLADGLGTALGSAYLARFHYIDRNHSTPLPNDATPLSKALLDLISYANSTTYTSSNSGKYFFANATTDGTKPVSDEALAILKAIGGSPDIFGKAYHLPAGAPGADKYGNSRPFQTEPTLTHILGRDYFGVPTDNIVYNRGPIMDLTNSPSYPSGHTTYGYTGSLLLAVLVPDRYPEMMTRAAEYGNDRIIIGAHYVMDVLGGRAVALYDLAHLLADDKAFMNQSFALVPNAPKLDHFSDAVKTTRKELAKALEAACGNTIAVCARQDTSRMSDAAMNETFYTSTLTYGLPVVHPETANIFEDVEKLAPEAGYLLTVAFPTLSLSEACRILTETEAPGGGFLDDGKSPLSVYSRLNLYAASRRALQLTTKSAAAD
jgi:PAP2 superfamily